MWGNITAWHNWKIFAKYIAVFFLQSIFPWCSQDGLKSWQVLQLRAETKKLAKQSCASLARKPTLTAGVKGQAVGGIWEPFKNRRDIHEKLYESSWNSRCCIVHWQLFWISGGELRQLNGNSSDDVEIHDVDLLLMCKRPCKRALHSRWKRILFGWRCDGSRSPLPLLIPKRSHVCMQMIVASIGLRI